LAYQLLNNGLVVAAGILSDNTFCCGSDAGYQTIAFSGGGFDEVQIQGDSGLTAFNPNSSDIMAIDSITATSVTPNPGRAPALRHRPGRDGSAWLAQETEGFGGNGTCLIKQFRYA
jgi:hypothetical protein